jgi:hypothetical protein
LPSDWQRSQRYNYDKAKQLMHDALVDLDIIAGSRVGPSRASWQDVAGTAAVNLRCLANQLEAARTLPHDGPIVFPCPRETLDD